MNKLNKLMDVIIWFCAGWIVTWGAMQLFF